MILTVREDCQPICCSRPHGDCLRESSLQRWDGMFCTIPYSISFKSKVAEYGFLHDNP